MHLLSLLTTTLVVILTNAKHFSSAPHDYANNLRRLDDNSEYLPPPQEEHQMLFHDGEEWRKLEWYIDQKLVETHVWADYDKDEVPTGDDKEEYGDDPDFLSDDDECYNSSNGRYSREYCPSPPDCNLSSKSMPWKMKLCINRIPKPSSDDKNEFFVKIMKCIPIWENCDKCMCGRLKTKLGRCIYTGSSPDDDRVDLECDGDYSLDVDSSAFSSDANPWYLDVEAFYGLEGTVKGKDKNKGKGKGKGKGKENEKGKGKDKGNGKGNGKGKEKGDNNNTNNVKKKRLCDYGCNQYKSRNMKKQCRREQRNCRNK